jgi:phosphatidate cytidylyltransferase
LKQRIITGVAAAALFIGLLYWGGYAYGLLIALMAVVGFHEYARLNHIAGPGSGRFVGYLAVLGIVIPFELMIPNFPVTHEQFLWCTMLILLTLTVFAKDRTNLRQAAIVLTGVVYIGYGFHYMIVTRLMPEDGLLWSLFIFGCIWLTDSGAYFSGMLFGRHHLAPQISPKKTVEGAIGGVLVALLFAAIFALLTPEWISLGRALALAAVIAVVGQIGDLIQSAYKRMQGVKDSGSILPGHGGILDRTDSWLVVFPAIHLLGLL